MPTLYKLTRSNDGERQRADGGNDKQDVRQFFGHIVLAEQGPSVQVEGCQADKAAVAGDRLAVDRQQRYGKQRKQRNADAACNSGHVRSGAVVHEETPI